MLASLIREELRFLCLRAQGPEFFAQRRALLGLGLFFTWLAGVGRYWDNPRAQLWQHLGLGSLAYVFVLSAILWCVCAPLKPRNWTYGNVLLFVTLTSPPAVLYAIPVERFFSMEVASSINAWFLALIATWRVALLLVFLWRAAELRVFEIIACALLPLSAIVAVLTLLNLEQVMFEIMSGILPENRSPNDAAYLVVMDLAYYALYAFPASLVLWIVCCLLRRYLPPKAEAMQSDKLP